MLGSTNRETSPTNSSESDDIDANNLDIDGMEVDIEGTDSKDIPDTEATREHGQLMEGNDFLDVSEINVRRTSGMEAREDQVSEENDTENDLHVVSEINVHETSGVEAYEDQVSEAEAPNLIEEMDSIRGEQGNVAFV